MKKIAFHSNQLGLRGTEVAMFDYAKYNQSLLGNASVIIAPNIPEKLPALQKFMDAGFGIFLYRDKTEIDDICKENAVDVFYATKAGENDGVVATTCKTVIHAVFKSTDYHGDVYAYISEWLANTMTGGKNPFVPYIVPKITPAQSIRKFLGIPETAIVYGYHGGEDSFDIQFVKDAVCQIADTGSRNVYFIFMNVAPFYTASNNRITFLPGTYDAVKKRSFISTCDYMLHARFRGETFGLSCAEFSSLNKPILTYANSDERQHLDILGDCAIQYTGYSDVKNLLESLPKPQLKNYDCYTERFSPEKVMEQFDTVFLK